MEGSPSPAAVEFLILGPLEVHRQGQPLPLRSAQRSLLAALLLHRNEVVSSDRLIDELWRERPPETALNLLQVYISQLRKLLEPDRGAAQASMLLTRAPGYLLQLEPETLDSVRFERLLQEGIDARLAGELAAALAALEQALALWRGPALLEFAYDEFAEAERSRLEELRLLAQEERIEAALALGRHSALVAELEALLAANPLRERLAGQLMLALYRSGRQAEALEAYSRTRRRLVDELGIEPGLSLAQLERAILNQEPSLTAPERAAAPPALPRPKAPPAVPERTVRKIVTVLFADCFLEPLHEPELDPELAEPLLSRLGGRVAEVIERHGGSLSWSSELELVGAFGIPHLHEDDALRATRAAVELLETLTALSDELEQELAVRVQARIGLNTGAVVAGVSVSSPATGGVARLAARLSRAAPRGEIQLSESTRVLVGNAVTVEPAKPVAEDPDAIGWRLLSLAAGAAGIERKLGSPLVGRSHELQALLRSYEQAKRERCAVLVTLLGAAGIGKTRLAAALAEQLAGECRVLSARCLSYGAAGLTPVAALLRELTGPEPLDRLRHLLAEDEERDAVIHELAPLLGLGAGGGAEMTQWALRRLLEALARERPLLVVVDDLHWADPSLLDLIDYVIDWAVDAPILLLGLGRPELLDLRPAWGGGKRNVSSLLLGLLSHADGAQLVDNLLSDPLEREGRERIVDAAGGNPFFLEQMLAYTLAAGEADEQTTVPPTVQALIAARLEQLAPAELAVLEDASVIGEEFWTGTLEALAASDGRLANSLRQLVREQLIVPARSMLPGSDAFRFISTLIRAAIYESVPKRTRALQHEQIADWLEQTLSAEQAGYDEAIGYQLEQAHRYRRELGLLNEQAAAVGRRGAERLGAAGRRLFARGDMRAAADLLRRATALLALDEPSRPALLLLQGESLYELGEFERARAALREAAETAAAGENGECLALEAKLYLGLVDAFTGDGQPGDAFIAEAEQAASVCAQAGAEGGAATAYRMLAWAHGTAGRYQAAAEAAQRAIEQAASSGDERQRLRAATQYALAVLHGPTPVAEAIEHCNEIVERASSDRRTAGLVSSILGWLVAMQGEFELARALAVSARALLLEFGTGVLAASTSLESAQIELLADQPAQAETLLRRDYETLQAFGEHYLLSTVAADLAEALYRQGRLEEALGLSREAQELAAADDVTSQAYWRSVQAKIDARRGEHRNAAALARQAMTLLRPTDDLVARARVEADLAEISALAGRPDVSRRQLREALALLEQKGNTAAAAQLRRRAEQEFPLSAATVADD